MIKRLRRAYLQHGLITTCTKTVEETYHSPSRFNPNRTRTRTVLRQIDALAESGNVRLIYEDVSRYRHLWSAKEYSSIEYRNLLSQNPLFFVKTRGYWYCRIDGEWYQAEDHLKQTDIIALARMERDKRSKRLETSRSFINASQRLPNATRKKIPDDIKHIVYQRDKGSCVECESVDDLQFDHIIPFSRGGSDSVENLQLLCGRCNRLKGNSLTVMSSEPPLPKLGSKSQIQPARTSTTSYIQIPWFIEAFNQSTIPETWTPSRELQAELSITFIDEYTEHSRRFFHHRAACSESRRRLRLSYDKLTEFAEDVDELFPEQMMAQSIALGIEIWLDREAMLRRNLTIFLGNRSIFWLPENRDHQIQEMADITRHNPGLEPQQITRLNSSVLKDSQQMRIPNDLDDLAHFLCSNVGINRLDDLSSKLVLSTKPHVGASRKLSPEDYGFYTLLEILTHLVRSKLRLINDLESCLAWLASSLDSLDWESFFEEEEAKLKVPEQYHSEVDDLFTGLRDSLEDFNDFRKNFSRSLALCLSAAYESRSLEPLEAFVADVYERWLRLSQARMNALSPLALHSETFLGGVINSWLSNVGSSYSDWYFHFSRFPERISRLEVGLKVSTYDLTLLDLAFDEIESH